MDKQLETNHANTVSTRVNPAGRLKEPAFSGINGLWNRLAHLELTWTTQLVLLAGITLLAMALRFYKLGEWSFWWDEMFTIRDVREVTEFSLVNERISRVLIALAVNSLGLSEWSARLVPALAGMITIPILYFPIRKMYDPGVALLASLLLAISPWHLYWSQNARFYTIILLFYSLAMFAFYFGIEKDKPLYLLFFFIFLGLATQERLFSLFFVPVVVLYWLIVKFLPFEKPPGLRTRNLVLLLAPSLLGGLFVGREFTLDPAKWFNQFAWVNNGPFWILSGVAYYIGIPVMMMGVAGAAYLLSKKDRAGLLLILSATIPLASVMVLSMIQFTANRYVFGALTSWILLAAVAMRGLLAQTRGLARFLALGVLAILILEPMGENLLYYQYQHGNRDNWKAAFELIKRRKEPGDMVVTDNFRIANYYLQEKTVPLNWVDLESLPSQGQRVWFVEDINVVDKQPPEVIHWIQNNSQMVGIFDVPVRARTFTMRVYLFDPAGP
jgi:mannosyltransferase